MILKRIQDLPGNYTDFVCLSVSHFSLFSFQETSVVSKRFLSVKKMKMNRVFLDSSSTSYSWRWECVLQGNSRLEMFFFTCLLVMIMMIMVRVSKGYVSIFLTVKIFTWDGRDGGGGEDTDDVLLLQAKSVFRCKTDKLFTGWATSLFMKDNLGRNLTSEPRKRWKKVLDVATTKT